MPWNQNAMMAPDEMHEEPEDTRPRCLECGSVTLGEDQCKSCWDEMMDEARAHEQLCREEWEADNHERAKLYGE